MNDVPENSMILFEDIDCMKAGNRREDLSESSEKQHSAAGTEKSDITDRFGVTLSELLNVLDGVHAPENVVYVMTTNNVEALDPALLRPGRIDYRLFMGQASEAQRIELLLQVLSRSDRSRRERVRAGTPRGDNGGVPGLAPRVGAGLGDA
jgi:mitochondrial chaperone BCS1